MDIRKFFKTDLAGKLEENKKRYQGSYYIFDHNLVRVSIGWNTVYAYSYSNTPHALTTNHQLFYQSKKFGTFHEARGHAEMEIGKAMLKFPKTRFTLSADDPSGVREYSEYRNGERIDADLEDSTLVGKLCYCGARFEGATCPKCGEWNLD